MAWQRKTPFGYIVQGGETVPCPAEADAVQGIFARYLAGASYGRIAEEMSRGNIPYHQRTRQWNKHMVKRILENDCDIIGLNQQALVPQAVALI